MLKPVDLAVLVAYLTAVVGLGVWFARRSRNTEEFMAADRSLPGWAIGLSLFGTYISSLSFLGNPGEAYKNNWNAFVFSLATPIAAAVAVRWFVPFYRSTGDISAYEHLESRFGAWARTYAVVCFLLTQVARTGIIVYLLAIAVHPLTGWEIRPTILLIGTLMTVYTMAGGIQAVVWVGVMQSLVLIAGPIICLAAILTKTPGGLAEILQTAAASDKFSLGSYEFSFVESTFWVSLLYGFTTHLNNYGVDQGFVQRFITARSDREAAKSVWISALLYVPVAGVFFFIGTSLWVFYRLQPQLLAAGIKPDQVFPHFIATELPIGMAGLVVAAIFAAAMDPSLNAMATLTLCDLYQRYLRPQASQRESMLVLRGSTLFWGALGTGMGVAMVATGDTALQAWWKFASIFSGGVLGLFLLGLVSRRADNAAAAIAVTLGVAAIAWISLPGVLTQLSVPAPWHAPMHVNMTMVVGTLTIFLVGLMISALRGRRTTPPPSEIAR
jgi:SSS family solute:Na+ symporter